MNMFANECECRECENNEDGECSNSYIQLDKNGLCLDKHKRSEND